MAAETLSPDGLLLQTNLAGTISDIQDDPDNPDAAWLTSSDPGSDTEARVSFPPPSGSPSTGAGLQEFRTQVRRTNNSTSAPSVTIELYESGALVATLVSAQPVNSSTGEVVSATWDASLLGTPDGSAVELRVLGSTTGGKPADRNTVELGAVEWNAEAAAPQETVIIGAASISTTGQSVTTAQPTTEAPAAASVSTTGQAATTKVSVTETPAPASISTSGKPVASSIDVTEQPGPASISLTGQPVSTEGAVVEAVGSAAISVTGQAASSVSGVTEQTSPASISYTGQNLQVHQTSLMGRGVVSVVGRTVSTGGGGGQELPPQASLKAWKARGLVNNLTQSLVFQEGYEEL